MATPELNGLDIPDVRADGVDVDALFDVLSNSRRRFVVALLDGYSRPMAMADVATELTNWESDPSGDETTDDQVTSRYIELYHVHVPKMADEGVIVHDQDRNTIELTDAYTGITSIDEPPLSRLSELRRAV